MTARNKNLEILKKYQKEVVDTLGKDFWTDMSEVMSDSQPPADVYDTGGKVVVVLELPGLKGTEDVQLAVNNNTLLVKGRVDRDYQQTYNLLQDERLTGSFERKIILPVAVNPAGTTAVYKHGLLEIGLYKSRIQNERQIKVQFME
ncbi:MAG: Hsp20/alpha crystallin family protein [Firmicutes bacterium]|nr:Hsp20/alpha crystallin family protein [Bacillota bacterium]